MRVLVQNTLTNRQWVAFDGPSGFSIGRDESCDVRLDSRFVSAVHVRIERQDGKWEIQLLPGVNPVEVDGKEYPAGQRVIVRDSARLRLMEFVLTLVDPQPTGQRAADSGLVELQNTLHANVLRWMDLRVGGWLVARRCAQ